MTDQYANDLYVCSEWQLEFESFYTRFASGSRGYSEGLYGLC
jgi:hypothetical protein